ncbi:MAG TPA: hypothetical protein VL986_14895 [Terracidiphilus sp.]|nr:hypothetical protein [Terracidiphilus sp.]
MVRITAAADLGRAVFRSSLTYNILILAVTKRKPTRFSATKAVKANARERVGQPKPARVIDDKAPRTLREAKHKPKLEDILRDAE